MPMPTWFEYAVVLAAGFAVMKPIWTYTERGMRPAAEELVWNALAWLAIALLVTRPTRPSTAGCRPQCLINSES
jgi:hypothetical protein